MKYNTEIRRVLIGSISFVIIIIWLIVWQHQDTQDLLITSYIELQMGSWRGDHPQYNIMVIKALLNSDVFDVL